MTDEKEGRDVETGEAVRADAAPDPAGREPGRDPGAAEAGAPEERTAGVEEPGVEEPGGEGSSAEGSVVEELRRELGALNDRHLRLAAEFDNYRKRHQRDRQVMATRLQTELVASLLDVLDDLQRVEENGADATAEAVVEGVRLVERKFLTVLEGAGLEEIRAAGDPFDPEIMEALMTIPTDDPKKDGIVADVFQRGYRFRDVLVRPARVRVLQYEESE